MSDTIRDLLISLASHMAYMQGQLEAHHQFDDPEDYYWYRESVLLRQKVADALAEEPAAPESSADVSQLSDGYHTFAELYEHRHSLMLALMRALPHICWFSRRHADGELPFGSDDWFIVGAELPGAPITYHLPAALYSQAQKTGALELPAGRPWDGHTAADVVQRLRDWAITPTPPADGEVAKLVVELRRFRSVSCHRAAELLERQVLVPVADWSRQEVAFPGEQYHEDMGAVTWWRLPVNEPPWVGTPNDSDWPGYHTHFTPAPPVPVNVLPLPEVGEQ